MKFYTIISAAILLAGSAVAAPDVDAIEETRAALFAETSDDNATNESIISRAVAAGAAGAAMTAALITKAQGTLVVPRLYSAGSAAAWVGLDGGGCSAALRAGVTWESSGKNSAYYAFYQWAPGDPQELALLVDPSHSIAITIATTSRSSGTVTLENLTTGKTVSQNVQGQNLCFTRAEWVVGHPKRLRVSFPGRATADPIEFSAATAIKNKASAGARGAQGFGDVHSAVEVTNDDSIIVTQNARIPRAL